MKKIKKLIKKQGFTLVELIIVIAIIAVLAVAAFMMLTKWLGKSRDSRKLADIETSSKAIMVWLNDLDNTQGIAPEPDNAKSIFFDGVNTWTQGEFGEGVISKMDGMQKAPTNPTNDSYYTYSRTTNGKKYQIATELEDGSEVTALVNNVFAGTRVNALRGNFNPGIFVFPVDETNLKAIYLPSIIGAGVSSGDDIKNTQAFVLDGKSSNLIDSVESIKPYKDVIGSSIDLDIVWSGTAEQLSDPSTLDSIANTMDGMVVGTITTTQVSGLLSAGGTSTPVPASSDEGSNEGSDEGTTTTPSCATQPSYTNADFVEGNPSNPNTSWQNTNSSEPCYYSCTGGYEGDDCSSLPSCATQPSYNHAIFTEGNPTTPNTTWQNTDSSAACYYECKEDYSGDDCATIDPSIVFLLHGEFDSNTVPTSENFDNTTINELSSSWNILDINKNSIYPGTWSIENQQLKGYVPSGAGARSGAHISSKAFRLKGDFQISWKADTSQAVASANDALNTLGYLNNGINQYYFGEYRAATPNFNARTSNTSCNTSFIKTNSTNHNDVTSYRMTRSGNTLTAEYKNTNTSDVWTTYSSCSNISGNFQFNLASYVSGNVGQNNHTIYFDDLQISGEFVSTAIINDGSNTSTISNNGDMYLSNTKKFGNSSMYFDGNGDYAEIPDSEDLTFGSDNFTIDFWINKTQNGTIGYPCGQMANTMSQGTISIYCWTNAQNIIRIGLYSGTTGYWLDSTTSIYNSWHHVAGVREGNTFKLYVDGVMEDSMDISGLSVNNSSNKFSIGRLGEYDTAYFPGYIDEFRIVKGEAVRTSNFTKPTSAY